jgi:hypothetical protein
MGAAGQWPRRNRGGWGEFALVEGSKVKRGAEMNRATTAALLLLALAACDSRTPGTGPAASAPPAAEAGTMCTMDAKQCPDGSYVGRVPPSCQFAPCPGQ